MRLPVLSLTTKLLTVLAVTYALAAPARGADSDDPKLFKQAVEQFTQKDFAGSRDNLKTLVKRSPKVAMYWFNLGNAYMMLFDHASALRCYGQVIALKSPLSPAAQLYKAKALRGLANKDEARTVLESLIANSGTPAGIREQAQAELKAIAASDEPEEVQEQALALYKSGRFREAASLISSSRFQDENTRALKDLAVARMNGVGGMKRATWAFADLALGTTSNAYLEAESSSTHKQTSVGRAAWGVGRRFWKAKDWVASGSYTGSWDEYVDAGDLKVLLHSLALQFGRQTDTKLLQLTAFADHESWANEPVVTRTGARFSTRFSTEEMEIGGHVSYSLQKSLGGDRGYLDGSLADARLFTGWPMGPVYGQVYVFMSRQATGDQTYSDESVRPYAYNGLGGGARLVWRLDEGWTMSAQASYEVDTYPTLEQPDAKERKDNVTAGSMKVSKALSSGLAAYVSASQRMTKSTLGSADSFDENNAVTNAFIGVTWDLE